LDSKIRLFGPFSKEKENPDLQGKDSNLCCQVKSTQNCRKYCKFWRLLAQFFSLQSFYFLVLFCAFIRSAYFVITVMDLFVVFGDSDPKDPDLVQILFLGF
jgi:hypothetical protein